MAEVEGASAPAINGATRVEYELQLYYWVKLIRGSKIASRGFTGRTRSSAASTPAPARRPSRRHLRAAAGRRFVAPLHRDLGVFLMRGVDPVA